MADLEVGKVIHYYDKAMVAVVRLAQAVKTGDTVKFAKGDEEFETKIESMQLNHEQIEAGKAGEEIAIKVPSSVKVGTLMTKVETA